MYSVNFSDGKEFKFTKSQITLIPYFNTLISSSSFIEKDIIFISSSSIGFKYLHIYSTMDEIDITDPLDKYLFAIKQCDYFGYDKLKTLLENKYGYKIDIKDVKENIGKEITIKLKYLGRIKTTRRKIPIYNLSINHRSNCHGEKTHYIDGKHISENGMLITYDNQCTPSRLVTSLEIYSEFILHKYFSNYIIQTEYYTCTYGLGAPSSYDYERVTHIKLPKTYNTSYSDNDVLYCINTIYEYPNYSKNNEIDEIFKKKYKEKHNIYFINLIQSILLLNKDEIICVKINNSYKLLAEINEDEYKNIEHIIIKNEPNFNNNYFIKYLNNELEIYENI